MFDRYLLNDRVEIERIPLKAILDKHEKLFIFYPHRDKEGIDAFFLHLTGKNVNNTESKILLVFDEVVHVNFVVKHDVVISNNGRVLANHRKAAQHIIIFDPETFTVLYLQPNVL